MFYFQPLVGNCSSANQSRRKENARQPVCRGDFIPNQEHARGRKNPQAESHLSAVSEEQEI